MEGVYPGNCMCSDRECMLNGCRIKRGLGNHSRSIDQNSLGPPLTEARVREIIREQLASLGLLAIRNVMD